MPVSPPVTPPPPVATQCTALDLIKSALRLIKVQAAGEPVNADEAQDALFTLNQMIDEWQTERLMIFQILRQVLVPTTNKQLYTVGAGGDFNITRPARIDRYSVITNPGASSASILELPLEYFTEAQWRTIPVKGTTATFPKIVWDDDGFPFRNLSFWPIANSTVNYVIYSWAPLSNFPDLSTVVLFPPAYYKAIRYNLAVDLAPEFEAELRPEVQAQAVSSKAKIKTINQRPNFMSCDRAIVHTGRGIYDWLTDDAGKQDY